MSTVQPQGEAIRRAVKWISEERQSGSSTKDSRLVEQAAVKYNLSPQEVEFLSKFVKEEL